MRMKEIRFEGENCLIIYMSPEEKEDEGNARRVQELKSSYKCISIFISGNADTDRLLKQLVKSRL